MAETSVFRIRIMRDDVPVYFVNAMSPARALTSECDGAERFMNELTAINFFNQIVQAGVFGQSSPYFCAIKKLIFADGAQRATIHIDSVNLSRVGSVAWSESSIAAIVLSPLPDSFNNQTAKKG